MDRKQFITERVRDIFTDRIDDVLHMVQQDRQALRGWEEPTHLRSVLRRRIREAAGRETTEEQVAIAELEFGRAAGEPDRGQQREATGQILQAGAAGLEKIERNQTGELTAEEMLGLECVTLLYGRPAIVVCHQGLGKVPAFWNRLEDQREAIELVHRGVGRIELLGHPDYDWAGTGFLVSDTCLLTTSRTAELFVESSGAGQWQFRPGISAWMDYRSEYGQVPRPTFRVRTVLGMHEHYDLALLEVDPPHEADGIPSPLALAGETPSALERRPVYMIGYPVRDARRNDPEPIARIFRDVYNVKRVQPGTIRGVTPFNEVHLLHHDCAMLGNSAGSPIIDLETHQVLGMHVSGRYLETGTAIPLWVLRDDPLLRQHGVCLTATDSKEVEQVNQQVERLARSRLWNETRSAVTGLYQRAFGNAQEYA